MIYLKKSFVKRIMKLSKTSGINFAKMFIDMKSKLNGTILSSIHSSIPFLIDRLQGVKENVGDLQQRLQQYQKKNDEMHEKIGTLERKVSIENLFPFEMNRMLFFSFENLNNNVMNIARKSSIKMPIFFFYRPLMNE